MQARRRGDMLPARIGFTVTKRTAKKAVERNRIRRRLREAARLTAAKLARPGTDYVLVGRRPALTMPFAELTSELGSALSEVGARLTSTVSNERARRPANGQ